jgi:hypothetical protein
MSEVHCSSTFKIYKPSLHQRHTNLIKIPIFPPQPPEPHHLQRDRRTDGGQSQAQRSRRLLPRLASQGDSTLIIIKLPPGAKNADTLPLPSLTNSTKSLCPHRAHPRDLLPGPHHLPPMKYPMHPLAQAGAPSSNARSPELGGRAKPQLPPPQPPRHHLPLRPLPSRRRVRNYPRGHSGDVSTPFIFDLHPRVFTDHRLPGILQQTPTYNLLFAAPRPRRLSCSRLPVRDSLVRSVPVVFKFHSC